MADPNDQHMQRDIREGTPSQASAAFSLLYDLHAARVYTYARRMLSGAEASAEDLTQQVFVNFYEKIRAGAQVENVRAYLLRSARNLCLNEFARQKPTEQFLEELYTARQVSSYEHQELITLIYAAIDKLPDEYKEVVVLREQMGMALDEIAALVGISYDNARARSSRAMKMLRTLLADYISDLK